MLKLSIEKKNLPYQLGYLFEKQQSSTSKEGNPKADICTIKSINIKTVVQTTIECN